MSFAPRLIELNEIKDLLPDNVEYSPQIELENSESELDLNSLVIINRLIQQATTSINYDDDDKYLKLEEIWQLKNQAKNQNEIEEIELDNSRRINYYLRNAREFIRNTPRGLIRDRINELLSYATDYLNDVNRKKIMLEDKNKKSYRFMPYDNRLNTRYRGKLKRKLSGIKNLSGVGITLTLVCFDIMTIFDDLIRIKKCWNNLRIKLERKYGKFEFFVVPELGKKNYMVHLHLITNIKNINQKWLSEEWKKITNGSYIVWVSKRNKNALEYLDKYLLKCYNDNNSWGWIQNVLIWASGLRQWSVSQGLIERVKHEKTDWGLIGCVETNYTGLFLIEGVDYG